MQGYHFVVGLSGCNVSFRWYIIKCFCKAIEKEILWSSAAQWLIGSVKNLFIRQHFFHSSKWSNMFYIHMHIQTNTEFVADSTVLVFRWQPFPSCSWKQIKRKSTQNLKSLCYCHIWDRLKQNESFVNT